MSRVDSTSVARVQPNLAHTFGGILRLTWSRFTSPGQWWVTLGILAFLVLFTGVSVRDGRDDHYFSFTSEFYLTFLIPVVAFLSGGGAIRDEMKGHAVDYVLTRPLPRWAFVVFKYTAHLLCFELMYLVVFAALMGVGFYRHIPGLVSVLPLLLGTQVIGIAVFLCLGLLCGILTSRYLVVGLLYGALVEAGISRIPIQLSALSMTHHLRTLLERLNAHPAQPVRTARGMMKLFAATNPGEPSAFGAVAILIGATVSLLLIAAALFSQKEFAGSRPGEA